IHNTTFKARFHFTPRTWPTARPFYPPVSRFLSIAFALVASDVVQGPFRHESQLQFEGGFWQCCTVQRMPRVHDTLHALMISTDTMREIFDLR
ncbi:hypothetical protein EV363DRAFT_1156810, partial [Boletus edulis]